MGLLHVPTSRDTPADGYWGVPTAIHQFCEPKYATSPYVAEFYNSMSCFIYVFAAAYVLSRREVRADPMLVLEAFALVIIGLGSVAFHGTMLFEYELCDEVPMLIFISIGLVMKCGAHPLLLTRGRCLAFAVCVTAACASTIMIYAKLANYGLFVASFTLFVLVDVVFGCTWRSRQRVTTWAMYMSIGCIAVGKLIWEVEVRACSTDGRVWPLHVVWHGLSCASAYYGLLADMANRIDCGLSAATEPSVPLAWPGVPFSEVRVVVGAADGPSKAK